MRVLNDRTEKEPKPVEVGFMSILVHSLYCALGLNLFIFGPLAMLYSHLKLSEPWPKITVLLGVVLAITFFKVNAIVAVLIFVFGLFISDSVQKEMTFWPLARNSLVVSTVAGAVLLFFLATQQELSMGDYWTQSVAGMFARIEGVSIPSDQIEQMQQLMTQQGFFIYLGTGLIILWITVGAAAHFGWLSEKHPLRGEALRELRLAKPMGFVFVALFIAEWTQPQSASGFGLRALGSGVFKIVSVLMFIQGCVFLSEFLNRLKVKQSVRSLVYVVSIIPGLLTNVLPLLGLLGPWILRRQAISEVKV